MQKKENSGCSGALSVVAPKYPSYDNLHTLSNL